MDPTRRQPPEVIRLLPQPVTLRTGMGHVARLTVGSLAICAVVIGAAGWLMLGMARAGGLPWLPDFTRLLLGPAVAVVCLLPLVLAVVVWEVKTHNAQARRLRNGMIAEHPEIARDPRCEALRFQPRVHLAFDFRRTADRIRSAGIAGSRLTIVCLPGTDIPAVEDVPIEPLVLPPSRTFQAATAAQITFAWLTVGIALLLLGLIGASKWLLGLCAAITVTTGAVWCWRVLFSPRYLRVAPGLIQVLRYAPFSRVARVADYPFDGQTLLFVRDAREKARIVGLVICRKGACESFSFPQLPEQLRTHLWHALMSTAPEPTPSADGLVG